MKILIIGTSKTGGGNSRGLAYKAFLKSQNHNVETILFPGVSLSSKLWYYYQRGTAKILNHEKRHMIKTADRLQRKIEQEEYDVVIGVETPWSYVLTRDLRCQKIFSCESLESEELYFSNKFSNNRVSNYRNIELEILKKADYVIFPWETTERYVRKNIHNGDNFLTIKYGCNPQTQTAKYIFPISLISLGNIGFYWSNKELLSYLTGITKNSIDVYGKYKPSKKYNISYKGFAPSIDIIRNYQFGLNTISKDIYRQNHFSSRILTYLSYGLPVFSPDWMKISFDLKGVLPYNRSNFIEILEEYSNQDLWEKMSKKAYEQALELDWNKVLAPLEKIISKC